LVQIKKESVRKAALDSAFNLFSKRGYTNTTLKQIANGAGITTTNIYRYYSSKLDVLFAVTRPWLNDILDQLEAEMGKLKTPVRA
jgi:AcrR family transcriptional regulator